MYIVRTMHFGRHGVPMLRGQGGEVGDYIDEEVRERCVWVQDCGPVGMLCLQKRYGAQTADQCFCFIINLLSGSPCTKPETRTPHLILHNLSPPFSIHQFHFIYFSPAHIFVSPSKPSDSKSMSLQTTLQKSLLFDLIRFFDSNLSFCHQPNMPFWTTWIRLNQVVIISGSVCLCSCEPWGKKKQKQRLTLSKGKLHPWVQACCHLLKGLEVTVLADQSITYCITCWH